MGGGRELKDRYRHIAAVLRGLLPSNYREALEVLDRLADRYSGFPYIFFNEFVGAYGLDDWEASLPALKRFTRMNTAEFAVRPFLEQDPARMLCVMLEWANDPDEHVRRLASEGSRPRLPWAPPLRALIKDPTPALPILDRLRADPSEYVRRSVANHLNDISKDHSSLVLRLAASWIGQHPLTDRLLKHACRTLLKRGDPDALRLFGFAGSDGHDGSGGASAGAEGHAGGACVSELVLEPGIVPIGGELRFSFRLTCEAQAALRLQFEVSYRKANGSLSPKRFHLAERRGFSGQELFSRTLAFRDLSTRKHYAGTHLLRILINGRPMAEAPFKVVQAFAPTEYAPSVDPFMLLPSSNE